MKASAGLKNPYHVAQYLLHHTYPVPVIDVKGQPRRMANWLPGCRLGDGRPGVCGRHDIMIIGKCPLREDADVRQVQGGPAGDMLRQCAKDVNFDELELAFCTNVVRFLPPDMGKTLRPHHIKDCQFMLAQEIQLVAPQYILLLGAEAVKAVFGKSTTLEKVRSHVYVMSSIYDLGTDRIKDANQCTLEEYEQGIKIFCTISPVRLLHEVGYKAGLDADLASFRDMVRNKRAGNPTPGQGCEYKEVVNADQLRVLIDHILETVPGTVDLAIDCEWGGGDFTRGKLRTVQFSWAARTGAVVVLRRKGLIDACLPHEQYAMLNELKRLFTHPRVKLSGHNLRADAKWLMSLDIDCMKNFSFDTMLADHALNENAEHGLEACAVRYTDMGRYDSHLIRWMKDNGITSAIVSLRGYADIDDDVLHLYSCCDVDATWRIAQKQKELLQRPENRMAAHCFYNTTMPCNYPIHEIEMNGIFVDAVKMETLVWEYDRKKDELLHDVRKKINNPYFNFRSYKQINALLFDPVDKGGLGLKPVKTTGKPALMWEDVEKLNPNEQRRYNPSTDGETLEALGDKHELAGMLRDLKIIDQVTKSFLRLPEEDEVGDFVYISGLVGSIDSDCRIRTTISQMSETGRWKSSDPNLQNLPKKQDKELERIMGKHIPKIRSCFTAPPGHVLIEADYKSAEIFVLGFLSNCIKLVNDARSDLHARGAVTRMGAPKWDGFDEFKSPPEPWLSEHKAIRVASKTVSFGIPYQRGAKAIAREIVKSTKGKVQCDTQRAQSFIDGFYEDYREVKAFVDMCKDSVLNPGLLFNPFGRTRRFFSGADEATIAAQQREAVNCPIQGTVADVLNTAVVNLQVWREMNNLLNSFKILLAIHDAILLQVPGEMVPIVYERALPECMKYGVQVPSWQPTSYWQPTQPFSLDIDIEVMIRWGEKASPEALRERGVPLEFLEKHHHVAKH